MFSKALFCLSPLLAQDQARDREAGMGVRIVALQRSLLSLGMGNSNLASALGLAVWTLDKSTSFPRQDSLLLLHSYRLPERPCQAKWLLLISKPQTLQLAAGLGLLSLSQSRATLARRPALPLPATDPAAPRKHRLTSRKGEENEGEGSGQETERRRHRGH